VRVTLGQRSVELLQPRQPVTTLERDLSKSSIRVIALTIKNLEILSVQI
jgi:hypothetical protein